MPRLTKIAIPKGKRTKWRIFMVEKLDFLKGNSNITNYKVQFKKALNNIDSSNEYRFATLFKLIIL